MKSIQPGQREPPAFRLFPLFPVLLVIHTEEVIKKELFLATALWRSVAEDSNGRLDRVATVAI